MRALEVLRAMAQQQGPRRRCVSVATVAALLEADEPRVRRTIVRLARLGTVRPAVMSGLRTSANCFVVTPAGKAVVARGMLGEVAPATVLQTRAWWTLRLQRKFSAASLLQLLAMVEDGDARRLQARLRPYLRALARAGVIAPLARGAEGQRYTLVEDLGPAAPAIVRGRVFDHNGRGFL